MNSATAETRLIHVVDDEDAVRRSLDFLLRAVGYRVNRWEDGLAFLKGVDPAEPAFVLMDVRMPGMDGLEVHAQMIEHGINLPVIVLTGHGDITMTARAMQAGAIDFPEKPFDRERLLQAVATAFRQLSDREAQRERAD